MTCQTVELALNEVERLLAEAGVWTPRYDAEVLIAHVLGIDQADLSLQMALDASAIEMLHQLATRRAERIPLVHITGRAMLGGVELVVGPGVFVPRVHTEPLLTWGLKAIQHASAPVVVDLCTGSGAIALAVAHARPDATVHAVDSDPVALNFARLNAKRRAAVGETPIRLYLDDVMRPEAFSELRGSVDLVLANPPYVPEGTVLLPEWGKYHPQQAIYAGDDEFSVTRSVLNLAARLLHSNGSLAIEHDDSQVESLPALLREHSAFTDITGGVDHYGRPRFVTARKR